MSSGHRVGRPQRVNKPLLLGSGATRMLFKPDKEHGLISISDRNKCVLSIRLDQRELCRLAEKIATLIEVN